MKNLNNLLNLVGRLLLANLFVPAGVLKLIGFTATVGYFTSLGMPLPTVGVVIAIIVELILGFLFVIGYQTRVVAIVIAIFTLFASCIGHPFWAVPSEQEFVTQLLFTKNIAVIGGLLVLVSSGAGVFSVDGFRKLN